MAWALRRGLFCGDVRIEVFFDDVEVSVGGAAEVFELIASKLEVAASADFLVDAGGADLVADGELAGVVGFVAPTLKPDPDVFLVVEEFATMAGRNGTENGAAEVRFGVDEVATGHESSATKRLRGVSRGGGRISDGAGRGVVVSWSIVRGGVLRLGAGVGDFEGVLDAGAGNLGDTRGLGAEFLGFLGFDLLFGGDFSSLRLGFGGFCGGLGLGSSGFCGRKFGDRFRNSRFQLWKLDFFERGFELVDFCGARLSFCLRFG